MTNVEWFRDIGIDDVPHVGGKNASLGEMYRELAAAGVRVPNGFATSAAAFRRVMHDNGVTEEDPPSAIGGGPLSYVVNAGRERGELSGSGSRQPAGAGAFYDHRRSDSSWNTFGRASGHR